MLTTQADDWRADDRQQPPRHNNLLDTHNLLHWGDYTCSALHVTHYNQVTDLKLYTVKMGLKLLTPVIFTTGLFFSFPKKIVFKIRSEKFVKKLSTKMLGFVGSTLLRAWRHLYTYEPGTAYTIQMWPPCQLHTQRLYNYIDYALSEKCVRIFEKEV